MWVHRGFSDSLRSWDLEVCETAVVWRALFLNLDDHWGIRYPQVTNSAKEFRLLFQPSRRM